MNEYQQEQREALMIARQGLSRLDKPARQQLDSAIQDYLAFRQRVDDFLHRHFSDVCNQTCFRSRTSACCSKDGIITFFADTVINALISTPRQVENLERALGRTNAGHRCIYLGDHGCLWTLRPVVCAMFLCDRAMRTVFAAAPQAQQEWEALRRQEKAFKWPDRPVLFDYLEQVFIDMGLRSTLMHLHLSPGLLRIKRIAVTPPSSCE
jgi:hypothetical protein